MSYTNFTLDIDADGIALVTWDMPGRSMNVFTEEAMRELNAIVDHVAGDAAIKGAVKEGSDFSGLLALKNALRARIIESLPSRDAGSPQTITDTSTMDWY